MSDPETIFLDPEQVFPDPGKIFPDPKLGGQKILLAIIYLQFLPGLETECDLNSLDDSKLVRLVQYVNSKQLILQVSNRYVLKLGFSM